MITYGYAKDYKYTGDGSLVIRVRIPSIHGPYSRSEYNGKTIRNYIEDKDLPYYPAVLLPHTPTDGHVAVISSLDDSNSQFIILGLTGSQYKSNSNV